MSILHTSDLHLRSVGDDRWDALERLVERAGEEGVSVLTIGGDLFDRDVDGERLRPDLRSLFSGTSFQVVLVSGNHDREAFREGLHFGENVDSIVDHEQPVVLGDENLRFWGIPYDDLDSEDVYRRIRVIEESLSDADEWLDCLLYHGQLVHSDYRNEGFGDEGPGKYMPLRLDFLDGTGLDYVLGGHYHSRFRSHSYEGGTFLYPGSPVPVNRSETGPRQYVRVRDEDRYEPGELEVPYYESLEITLRPDDERTPPERVRRRIRGLPDRARPVLTVDGYFDGRRLGFTEQELDEALRDEIPSDADTYEFLARDVRGIVGSDLFTDFEDRLAEEPTAEDPDNETVREMVLEAMMRAGLTRASD